ncbi:hypothetical protein HPP92_005396 [Vanilla planifolia]|uniref:RING-CH-type domain-containing protein n=1 Tax=Vanilla planifolia TaxID=51239 RepID=A0A835RK64_VANPL|nr:hypothetical protein HPP92_005396 [Vanilla planifolia]
MVGDLMVCVDRIISSTCFHADNGLAGGGSFGHGSTAAVVVEEGGLRGVAGCSASRKEGGKYKNKKKAGRQEVAECRICQEEGSESDMENPCACRGTLKYAHRKCIQKWCNKKGNTTCEICHQSYAPNYSAPPPQDNSDALAIDISRQAWGARIDLHDSHFLAIAAEQELLHAEYEDYAAYAAAHNSGIACCRSVALILMLLLFFRQIFMVASDPSIVQDVQAFFNLSLQFVGFLLPCYVIVRSCYVLQSRRREASTGFNAGSSSLCS